MRAVLAQPELASQQRRHDRAAAHARKTTEGARDGPCEDADEAL
jgi:hypothetical protein